MQTTPEFESKLILADRNLGDNTDAIREADLTSLSAFTAHTGRFSCFLPL